LIKNKIIKSQPQWHNIFIENTNEGNVNKRVIVLLKARQNEIKGT